MKTNKQYLFRLVFRSTIDQPKLKSLFKKWRLLVLFEITLRTIKFTFSKKNHTEMIGRILYFSMACLIDGRSIPIAPAIPIPPTMPAILLLTKNQDDLIEVMERYQAELRHYNIQLKKYNYEWDIYSDRLEKYWDQEIEEHTKLMNEMSQLSVRG